MLKEIQIKNFAIIDELNLAFSDGFNVFTGETGAGKSIILDAVSVTLGGKTDPTFVREGTDKATVEAVFDYGEHSPEIMEILKREELLPDDNLQEVVLTREIREGGRSTARINGHSANASLLQEIGAFLVDIHGQSQHLSLLKPNSHIHLVDRFAGNQELLKSYRELYKRWNALRRQLNELKTNEEESLRQQDMLSYQINEIESAQFSDEEEQNLLKERDRLSNVESLENEIQKCLHIFEGDNEELAGVTEEIGIISQSIESLAVIDGDLEPLCSDMINVSDMLEDVFKRLERYQDTLEFNPKRLDEIEERLIVFNSLKRKYGGNEAAINKFLNEAKQKLSLLMNAEERSETFTKEMNAIFKEMTEKAQTLSKRRMQAALNISSKIEHELGDLRMTQARFRTEIAHDPSPEGIANPDGVRFAFSDTGYDKVEFMIAPNPGEGFKPLAKIASGGETSRLMLAVKNTLAGADTIPTMIFDEIDQGIGGRIGSVVGQKLWELGRKHQVLCITHLPQLAAFYDEHFRVRKEISNDRTRTNVEKLDERESLHELASLLGGDTAENQTAAAAMIEEARQFKDDIIGKK